MTSAAAAVNQYDIGDAVQLLGTFTLGSSGEGYDATVVRVRILDPLGVITICVYGTDVEVVQDDTGEYSIIIRPTVAGLFTYRWEAEDSGDNARYGAEESRFLVRRSAFYEPTGTPSVGSSGSAGFDGGSP
jgi:hypothetical protein